MSVGAVALSAPPFDVPGLELVAWVPLLVGALSAEATGRTALRDGLWWAVLTGSLCTWWIATAVHDVLELDSLTAAFAVVGTGTLVAAPAALWPWLARRARRWTWGAPWVVGGVAALLSVLLTWPIPHALALVAHDLPFAGMVAWTGPAGLVGVVAAVNGALALAWAERRLPGTQWRHLGSGALALVLALFASVLASPGPSRATWTVGVVQAARPTEELERARAGDDAASDALLQAHQELSNPLASAVDLLVWPETVYPGVWRVPFTAAQRRRQVAFDRWVDEGTAHVMVGTWSRDPTPVDDRLYNAVVALTPDAVDPGPPRASVYRKHLLLPLAEEVPWTTYDDRSRLRYPFSAFFRRGPSPEPLRLGDVSLGVSICFEDLQPWIGRRHVARDARLLVNVANDGWFPSWGEPQWHLAAARLRAMEVGRALVRATNDGISAVFDADGRMLHRIPHGKAEALVATVPLHEGLTPFARFGSAPVVVLGLLAGMALRDGVKREALATLADTGRQTVQTSQERSRDHS